MDAWRRQAEAGTAEVPVVKGTLGSRLVRALPGRDINPATFAELDLENVRKFSAGMAAAALALLPVVLLLAPPNAYGTGWCVVAAAAWAVAHVSVAARLLRRPERVTWSFLLGARYLDLALLTTLQAMAGGWSAPYDQLMMAQMLAVGLSFAPRRSLPFIAVALLCALSPIAYGETHGLAADVVVMLWLWTALTLFSVAIMHNIRDENERLAGEARRDALTELENRRAFEETISARLATARAAGRSLALGIGDVDCFKWINDTFGHQAGDECLRAVAETLRSAVRQGDRVFRWAGDEFAILFDGVTEVEAARACHRLQDVVAAAVRDPNGRPVRITIGWAVDDGRRSPDELVASADESLLSRKRRRDNVTVA
jgi:diguanylate cyclase (GGDEF)-like protein